MIDHRIGDALWATYFASESLFEALPLAGLGRVPEAIATAWVYLDVRDDIVAWNAYRGVIGVVSADEHGFLSSFAAGRIRASFDAAGSAGAITLLTRELQLESLRLKEFPQTASRLRSIYAFPDRESAVRARGWGLAHFREENLVEVGIWPGSVVSTRDSAWITKHLRDDDDDTWRRAYLAGEPTSDPHWELIVEGKATVFDGQFRMAIRERLHIDYPASRPLLEIARIGGEIGSDAGAATQYLSISEGGLAVRFLMDARGFLDPGWLENFAKYGGPRDPEALWLGGGPDDFFEVPDWRSRALWIPF
jgi:hypothetical protein